MRDRVLLVIGTVVLLAPLSPVACLSALVLAIAMRLSEPNQPGDENW